MKLKMSPLELGKRPESLISAVSVEFLYTGAMVGLGPRVCVHFTIIGLARI